MDECHNSSDSELKFLDRLSAVELEALLKFSGDPADIEMLFDTIAEEVVAREKENSTGRLPNVETAWNELQTRYANLEQDRFESMLVGDVDLPDSSVGINYTAEQKALYWKILRTTVNVAATIVLSLALLVGVQATGADVFGALARWTDSTFHFDSSSTDLSNNSLLYAAIQESLNMWDNFGPYAPKWYPNGSVVADLQTFKDEIGESIQISLMCGDGSRFFISIDQYDQSNYIDPLTFEKETGTVEEYSSDGRTYFIFSNSEMTTAVFCEESTIYRIWGELSVLDVKYMIDSIGG